MNLCRARRVRRGRTEVHDPAEEARQRADEIYRRLLREMRSDLERMLGRAPAAPQRPGPTEPRMSHREGRTFR